MVRTVSEFFRVLHIGFRESLPWQRQYRLPASTRLQVFLHNLIQMPWGDSITRTFCKVFSWIFQFSSKGTAELEFFAGIASDHLTP
jgi:hypothetical protein